MNAKPAPPQLNLSVPTSATEPNFDATNVDPRPDARARLQQDRAQVDFGDDNLLFSHVDSAATPLGLGVDIGLDLVLDAAPSGKLAQRSHVGRYRLRESLSQGRSGRLYAAWDPMFSRELVLKLMHPGDAALSKQQRAAHDATLLRQARAVAGLSHSGIVTMFDVGISAQGIFLTMERPAGCDLRQLLAEGWRTDAASAAKLMRRLADALTYAHDNGVLHGQIQPAHIFMRDRRRPKLLDFALVRATSQAGRLTATSPDPVRVAHGANDLHPLHYRSPEQLHGAVADDRSDVYALGVVLYELLAGVRAFEGASTSALVQAVLQHAVPPAHSVNPEVPQALSLIAARAMARMPAQRYGSARALAAALRQWTAQLERESPPLAFAPLGARTSTAPQARHGHRLASPSQTTARAAFAAFRDWCQRQTSVAAVVTAGLRVGWLRQRPVVRSAWGTLRRNPAMPLTVIATAAALITALLALS